MLYYVQVKELRDIPFLNIAMHALWSFFSTFQVILHYVLSYKSPSPPRLSYKLSFLLTNTANWAQRHNYVRF